eukprot:1136443-Pelagomonas_calceolata.AAC.1
MQETTHAHDKKREVALWLEVQRSQQTLSYDRKTAQAPTHGLRNPKRNYRVALHAILLGMGATDRFGWGIAVGRAMEGRRVKVGASSNCLPLIDSSCLSDADFLLS